MSVIRTAATAIPLVIAMASCAGGGDQPPGAVHSSDAAPTVAAPTVASPARLTSAWTAAVGAVESPQPTRHGFALHVLSDRGTFEVVSVDAASGRILWRTDASPSTIAPGVNQSVAVVNGGRTVVWLSPGASGRAADTSIVAADAESGRLAWTYGGGGYVTGSPPTACHGGAQVCTIGAIEGAGTVSFMALDAATGKVVAQQPLSGGTAPRALDGRPAGSAAADTAGLLDTNGTLTGIDYDGRVLWSRLNSAVFGGERVSPNNGWDIQLRDGRWIGSLGYEERLDRSTSANSYQFTREPAVTAAFDVATGQTAWVRPHTYVACGSISFDVRHPVLCSGSGSIDLSDPTRPRGIIADITLEGVDPSTGRPRWTWHAGNQPGLVVPSQDVIRIDDTHYAVRQGQTSTTLDLDRGPSSVPTGKVGWCPSTRYVRTSIPPADNNIDGRYSAWGIHPCSVEGRTVDIPATTPDFAGGTVGGVFAWTDETGTVHAVKTS
jgi:outer membrane protein assembly factor BamB